MKKCFHQWLVLIHLIKTVFLNGSLDCENYMLQPEEFVDPDRPNHVCKLKKSTYGLINSQLIVGTLLWMSI